MARPRRRASHGECASPDDWTTECVEWCSCHGYVQTAVYATAGLMGAGLLLSLLLLRETKDSHLRKEVSPLSPPPPPQPHHPPHTGRCPTFLIIVYVTTHVYYLAQCITWQRQLKLGLGAGNRQIRGF